MRAEAVSTVEVDALSDLLGRRAACPDAVAWTKGRTFADAWASCKRADWMLWLAGMMAGKAGWPTRQQVVLAACLCAESVLHLVPEGEDRPRLAIEAARRWADHPTAANREAAAEAAWAAARAAGAAKHKELADLLRANLTVPAALLDEGVR